MDKQVYDGHSIVNDGVRQAVQHLSGCLAHDLNNILTPLLAYPEMIFIELPPESNARKLLKSLEAAAESAVGITRRLSELSGVLRKKNPHHFKLAPVVESVVTDLRKLPVSNGVRLAVETKPGINVFSCLDSISQAIKEIGLNALEALNGQGVVSICTGRETLDAPVRTPTHLIPAGAYVSVSVEDDGPGMRPDMVKQVFEPFSYAPRRGKKCGVGLGLSIAYCAVREADAFLLLESEPGHGTHVTILIPEAPVEDAGGGAGDHRLSAGGGLAEETASSPVEPAVPAGKRSILVVDDEPSIVNLFKLIIENYIKGVTVEKAMNGEEALALFKLHRHDVIVMDLHMPVMDGQTAFFEIQTYCNRNGLDMPAVVFCTGYAPRDAVKRAVVENRQHALLNKPVRSEILIEAVQSRLGLAS